MEVEQVGIASLRSSTESEDLMTSRGRVVDLKVVDNKDMVEDSITMDEKRFPTVPRSRDDRVTLDDLEEGLVVLDAASTCLLVSVSFFESADEEMDEVDVPQLARLMLARRIYDPDARADVPLWEHPEWPPETAEFDRHFRSLSGIEGEIGDAESARFSVTPRARELLFPEARLYGFTRDDELISHGADWSDVMLLIFPNTALLAFRLDWKTSGDAHEFSMQDLRLWSYLAKFKTNRPGVVRGWRFEGAPVAPEHHDRLRHSVGAALFDARVASHNVTLGAISNWLVRLPHEDVIGNRVSLYSHCRHHTMARVAGGFDPEAHALLLQQVLTQEGAASRYKETDDGASMEFMRPRENRLVALCQEGVVALEWGSSTEFYEGLALGALLVLTMHVVAERELLVKLSYLAARGSRKLGSARTVHEKLTLRKDVMTLVTSLTRYNLQMGTDHCGGRKLFRNFFIKLRAMFSVSALRLELREGLNDTLALVELDYQEEHREAVSRQQGWATQTAEIKRQIDGIKSRRRDIFSFIILIASAVFLPFNFTAGIFGMNNGIPDPTDASYWGYSLWLTACGCAGLIIISIIVFILTGQRGKLVSLKDQLAMVDNRMAVANQVTSYVLHDGEATKWSASGSVSFGSITSDPQQNKHDVRRRLQLSSVNLRRKSTKNANDIAMSESRATEEPPVDAQFDQSMIMLISSTRR
jgi:hypothetical protein